MAGVQSPEILQLYLLSFLFLCWGRGHLQCFSVRSRQERQLTLIAVVSFMVTVNAMSVKSLSHLFIPPGKNFLGVPPLDNSLIAHLIALPANWSTSRKPLHPTKRWVKKKEPILGSLHVLPMSHGFPPGASVSPTIQTCIYVYLQSVPLTEVPAKNLELVPRCRSAAAHCSPRMG